MDGQAREPSVDDLMGGGDCNEALHTLYDYLDGELTQDRRQAIKDHLEHCAPCLRAFDFEAELKSLVGRSCRDQVPENLRLRIAKTIEEASNSRPDLV